MRFPTHVPDAADDGRRPVRLRLATLGVAGVLVTAAALASPLAASADEAVPVAAEIVAEESAPAEKSAPAEEPAPAEGPASAEDPASAAAPARVGEQADEAARAEASAPEALAAPAEPAGVEPIEPVNLPPVAVDDHFVMVQDTTLSVDGPGFVGNDYDPEGDWMAVYVVSPWLGEWVIGGDWGFDFTPPAGFTGTREYTYFLEDDFGATGNTATITIDVLPAGSDVNLPPFAHDDAYSYALNTPLHIAAPGILANDTDGDGDVLTVSITTQPGWGSLVVANDGSFLFTPPADKGGHLWFGYEVCDESICAEAEVNLDQTMAGEEPSGPSAPPAPGGNPVVDLPPVAEPDTLAAVAGELAILDAPGVLDNDSDPEGQPLSLVGVTVPDHGVLYHWAADGEVQYVPNDGFTGTDQIEYTVSDGAHTSTSTVTFTVTAPANHAPQAWEDEVSMPAGTTFVLDAPGVLGNDSDQDGDTLAVTWFSAPQHGVIDIHADGSVSYTPDAGFTGTENVLYEASDGTDTSSAFLMIHVIPADAPLQPSALGDHYDAMSGELLEVPAPGVLGNDLAPSGPVTVVGHEPAQHGTIDIAADGSLHYTSDPGYTGADTIRYTISDGETSADAIISITVLGTFEDESGLPTEPTEPTEPGLPALPGLPTMPGLPVVPSEAGRPVEDGTAPAHPEPAAVTDASRLATTGADAGLALTLAALLTALGVALRFRRRAVDH